MAPIFTGSKFGFGRSADTQLITSGGTKISEPDGYTYHYFTTAGPNPFNVSGNPTTVDYIIIGSGGAGCGQPGGNNYGGGGGGAGGVRTGSITASVQNYTFNVAGITTALSTSYLGVMGSPSSSFGVEAQGGGSGGGYTQPLPETSGGSGGGAPHYAPSTVGLGNRVVGTATPAPAQGNNGGPGGGSASGGGGGGGGVGGASGSSTGGNGGIGVAFPTWTIPPSYGTPGPNPTLRYFAGGGGGGGDSAGGSGGYGGGGAGAASANGTAGTLNTGGGGGSCGGNGDLNGGSGGSGIIIVRYLT